MRASLLIAIVALLLLFAAIGVALTFTGSTTGSAATTGSASTSSGLGTGLGIDMNPNSALVQQGGNANFTVSVINPNVVLGTFPISVQGPPGLTFSVNPGAVLFSSSGSSESVNLQVTAPKGVPPGNYPATIVGKGPTQTFNATVTFHVVQYLIPLNPANFGSTVNLTVKVGSQVTWISLFNQFTDNSPGTPMVVIQNTASSPSLSQYQDWSYVFTTPGTYNYSEPVVHLVQGTITVTP